MSWTKRTIRGASSSDHHLGNQRTTLPEMLESLSKELTNDKVFSLLDIFILAGDLFDQMLMFGNPHMTALLVWITRLLRLCRKYGVVLRILEGTPSHDFRQSEIFVALMKVFEEAQTDFNIDCKYVKDVSVEIIDSLGISVLYVPDEARSAQAIYTDCLQAMAGAGLEQVDIAIMHGFFQHQVPKASKHSIVHNNEDYLALVRYFIFVGHVHQFSMYERILAHGSFDRTTHGDEQPKGWISFKISEDGTYYSEFVPNQSAKIYKDIVCMHTNLEDAFSHIDQQVSTVKPGSYLQIVTHVGHALVSNLKVIQRRFTGFRWSIKTISLDTSTSQSVRVEETDAIDFVSITQQNIPELLSAELLSAGHSHIEVEECLKLYNDLVH